MRPAGAGGTDAQEFEALVRGTNRDLLAYFLRRVQVREDAADLLARVYLVAWDRRSAVPEPPADRLWLFGVARNVLLDHRRESVRAHAAATALRAEIRRTAGAAYGSEVVSEEDSRARVVRDALADLAEVDRELLTLTVWEGMTPSEAAGVLGNSAANARVRLHRARARSRAIPPSTRRSTAAGLISRRGLFDLSTGFI